jgi:hypothetical protein
MIKDSIHQLISTIGVYNTKWLCSLKGYSRSSGLSAGCTAPSVTLEDAALGHPAFCTKAWPCLHSRYWGDHINGLSVSSFNDTNLSTGTHVATAFVTIVPSQQVNSHMINLSKDEMDVWIPG